VRSPRDWLEETQFYLQLNQGLEYSLFLAHVNVFFTDHPLICNAPACIGLRDTGSMYIAFNYPRVQAFKPAQAAEVLKHELLHAVFGHLGQYSDELAAKYSIEVILFAKDLVVNQHCDCDLFREAGLDPVTCELFDVPENQTLEEYCRLLSKDNCKAIADAMPQLDSEALQTVFSNDRLDDTGWVEITLPRAKEAWLGAIVNESKDADKELADLILSGQLEAIRVAMKQQGNSLSRGWEEGVAEEYIARFRSASQLPWQQYLRRMESHALQTKRVSSKRRPSRRHPAYYGFVTRAGLYAMVAVDTSGSMNEDELKLLDPELKALHQRGCRLDITHCDAKVAKVEPYDVHAGLVKFLGRGGTDFSPVFEYIARLTYHRRPAFLVFYTDGCGDCDSYLERKGVEEMAERPLKSPDGTYVLWLVPDKDCVDHLKEVVPFGEVRFLR
jgi:predicted metal-dependent peptidase